LALLALLKAFAPGSRPTDLFYRQGLKEFLAACGVHGPPANASYRSEAFAGDGVEGPRRIIFDVDNISQHEKTAGAKSEGLKVPTYPSLPQKHLKVMKLHCGRLATAAVICATLGPLQRSSEILHFGAQLLTTIRSRRAWPVVIYNDLVKDDVPVAATGQMSLRRSGPTGRSSAIPTPRALPDTFVCMFCQATLGHRGRTTVPCSDQLAFYSVSALPLVRHVIARGRLLVNPRVPFCLKTECFTRVPPRVPVSLRAPLVLMY
jgi:hypothetical protein